MSKVLNQKKIVNYIFGLMVLFTFGYILIGNKVLQEDSWGQDEECFKYRGTWYQIKADGSKEKISVPGKLDVAKGEIMTISTTLPDDLDKDTYLCFHSEKQDMMFYIDGELRGTYSNAKTRIFGKATPAAKYFVDIHPADAGKELRVEAVTDTSYTGLVYDVYQCSQAGLWRMVFSTSGIELIVTFGMIWICIIMFCVTLGLRIIRGVELELFYLVVGIFLAYSWEIANSNLRQLIFRNLSVVNDMAFLMILLLPLPFLLYMNKIQKQIYNKAYVIVEWIAVFDFVICVVLHNVHIIDYTDSFKFMALIAGISIILMAVTILNDVRVGRVKNYHLVAVGMFCVMIAAIVQIVSYLLKLRAFSGISLSIGLFVMFVFAAIHTVVQLEKTEIEKTEAILAKEAKGKFLASMSHEIRTPINAVLGMDTMILRETTERNIRGYALDIQTAGQSLLALINDILDMSKIESGKMEVVEAEYDFSSLIHDVINMVSTKAASKDLCLDLTLDKTLPSKLYGDDIRIRQVLVNIMNNAVKYTEAGSVHLSILGEKQGDKVLLHFSVKDTGIGIKEEDLGKLFAEFERIEESRNRNIEGTGLGMSITTQLLMLMGSKLQVESVYGEGSNFYFDLYQGIVDEEPLGDLEERIRNRVDEYDYTESFVAPDARVLLVDDNAVNRHVFVNLLKQTQMQIDEAAGGYECIEMASQERYDIIFLDHMMPDLDGIETLHRMQAMEDFVNKDTPIIALTANAVAGAKGMYLEEGFTDFLSKPIVPEKMEKMIMDYLPAELLHKEQGRVAKENSTIEKSVSLPEIEGVKWEMALALVGDEKILRSTITDFARLAETDIEELERYYQTLLHADVLDENDCKQYRVKVHAMKTSAAMIGAVAVSELARLLEYAARDERLQDIEGVMPFFTAEWNKLAEQVQVFLSQEEKETKKVDYNMVEQYLHLLEEAATNVDLDAMDTIADGLRMYQFPKEQQDIVDELLQAIFNIDYDKCVDLGNKLRERIEERGINEKDSASGRV